VIYPLTEEHDEVRAHDPLKSVRGGKFRGGYDLFVDDDAVLVAPVTGKIAHVYRLKTRCDGVKVPRTTDYVELVISEETIDEDKNRNLTGFRIHIAHFVPRLPHFRVGGPDRAYRHVVEGEILGDVPALGFVHFASKDDVALRAGLFKL
jgi:hypothetical protein